MNEPSYSDLHPSPGDIDALGADPAGSLLGIVKSYAPVDVQLVSPEDVDELNAHFLLAKGAAEKLQEDQWAALSFAEQQALTAYVHLVKRPSFPVKGGTTRGISDHWGSISGAKAVIDAYIKGVGRLDRVVGDERESTGTGWFVAPGRVMTNNHVVAQLGGIDIHASHDWRQDLAGAIDMFNDTWADDQDQRPIWDSAAIPEGDDEAPTGRVTRAHLHPTYDLAILDVEGVARSERLVLEMAADGPTEPDRWMYTIGYPFVGSGWLHPILTRILFGTGTSGMHKRVAPGRIRSACDSPIPHDATTLGGSSGSPVIDLKRQRVVGLHFQGQYGVRNDAVPLWKLHDDEFFGAQGLSLV